jgi:hypothetical protein
LFEDTVHCAGCKIVTWLAGNSDQPALGVVFELAMTATCSIEVPTIGLDKFDRIADFHYRTLSTLQSVVAVAKNCTGRNGYENKEKRDYGEPDVLHGFVDFHRGLRGFKRMLEK